MKSTGALVTLLLASLLVLAIVYSRPPRARAAEKEPDLVVTVRVSAEVQITYGYQEKISGGTGYTENVGKGSDSMSVQRFSEARFPVRGWLDQQPDLDFGKVVWRDSDTVGGGGSFRDVSTYISSYGSSPQPQSKAASWSYEKADPDPDQTTNLTLLDGGRFQVEFGLSKVRARGQVEERHYAGEREVVSTRASTECMGAERVLNRLTYLAGQDRNFVEKMTGSFDRRAKNLAGTATFSMVEEPDKGERSSRNRRNSGILTVNWSVSDGSQSDVEVEIIPPGEYEKWAPQAGQDEKTVGNFLDFGIVAHKLGKPDEPPPIKVRSYKVELVDTSSERGVALNWPPKDRATKDYDLKLSAENPYLTVADAGHQKGETKEEGLKEFMVTVDCFDWGAFGKLQVTATLVDGSTVQGHVRGKPDLQTILIPKDDNHNHVADSWESHFGLKSIDAAADDEASPLGDGDPGDGAPLYEEYRGFYLQGKHTRTSPEWKDVFIWDIHKIGLGYYKETLLFSHLVLEDETDSDASSDGNHLVLNANRGYGTLGPIWVVMLERGTVGDGDAGEAKGGPAVPKYISYVRIDTARIKVAAGEHAQGEIDSTIAHELSHANNVWHHGDGDYSIPGNVMCRRADGSVKNFHCGKPTGGCYQVAVQGGVFSGNDQCVMRYNSTDFYENAGGNCEWKRFGALIRGYRYHFDLSGKTYCLTPKGTGVNDPDKPNNKAGNAKAGRGACAYKFCVNSLKH